MHLRPVMTLPSDSPVEKLFSIFIQFRTALLSSRRLGKYLKRVKQCLPSSSAFQLPLSENGKEVRTFQTTWHVVLWTKFDSTQIFGESVYRRRSALNKVVRPKSTSVRYLNASLKDEVFSFITCLSLRAPGMLRMATLSRGHARGNARSVCVC
jgi:hypothetical protein